MSDSIQGPPDTTATTAVAPSYFPRRVRPGEAMKTLTRRVEYLNLRIHQRLSLDSTCQNGYDESERDAVLWALDTIHSLCRKLLGPLKEVLVVCDRCSVKLETRGTVNGELRVVPCQRCLDQHRSATLTVCRCGARGFPLETDGTERCTFCSGREGGSYEPPEVEV